MSALLRAQDYQYQVTLPSGPWRWVTRIDVSKAVVETYIRDIITPYGLLRDSIPLPGEVVQAMADSITEVLQAYAPSILLSPTTLDFVVDEGRGISAAKSVLVTNNGILGSLLSATITSSASYVLPLPANVDGLVSNASGTFEVSVDSTNLTSLASPLAAQLTVQSASASNSPQTIPVTITVRPKAEITPSATTMTFNAVKPLTGDFAAIPSQQFTLSNTGPATSVLEYQIKKLKGVTWLASYSPTYGSINGGNSEAVTVVVAPPSNLAVGTYTETLRITGYSSNSSVDVVITLNVT